ncbi:MAG: DNA polymerase III subunit delta [Chitinophagales bacterium]
MATTFEGIYKELKQKKYAPIYLLQGEETFFIDKLVDYIEESVLADSEKSFNQMIMYGKDTDADTLMNTARRYPMMSKYQVVILKEAQQMRDILKLESYATNPSKSTILVLAHKYKTIRGNTKLGKLIAKNGVVFTSTKLYDNQVPPWIQRYVKSKKYDIGSKAMQLLIEYLGTELSRITNEVDKLMLNVPTGTVINEQHILDNIGISKDYNVFELQRALAQNNTTKAYRIADYFSKNPKAAPLPLLLGSLYRFFSRLYLYHQIRTRSEGEILQAMGFRTRFQLQDYQAAIRHFNLNKTKKAVEILYTYDLKSKGIDNVGVSQEELIREMVVRLANGV